MKSKKQHQDPINTSRSYEEDMVMLSTSYYKSMETAHLLKSPENASSLMEGIEEYTKCTTKTEEFLLQQREMIGFEKGIKKIEARKNHDFVENLIVKLALSDEQIADVVAVSLSFVKKVRKEIASRK